MGRGESSTFIDLHQIQIHRLSPGAGQTPPTNDVEQLLLGSPVASFLRRD